MAAKEGQEKEAVKLIFKKKFYAVYFLSPSRQVTIFLLSITGISKFLILYQKSLHNWYKNDY